MTKFKAFLFRIVGLALGVLALVFAIISFDALGIFSVFALVAAITSLVLLKIANNFDRTLLGNLAFLAVFAIMMFCLLAMGVFWACGA